MTAPTSEAPEQRARALAQIGDAYIGDADDDAFEGAINTAYEAGLAAGVAAERERAAQVADGWQDEALATDHENRIARAIGTAIRQEPQP